MADEIVTVLDRPSNIEYLRGAVMLGGSARALCIQKDTQVPDTFWETRSNVPYRAILTERLASRG